jgi:mRNA interferase RelE/StbE
MASYAVEVRRPAERDLRQLPPKIVDRAWLAIRRLADDPLPRGAVKLTGSTNEYRLRVGVYRILYEVEHDQRLVTVFRVAHRREAYR